MSDKGKFNIRVYGSFINDHHEILLTDEFRFGMHITKFPGGGLQFGEGTVDCLKREMKEESGRSIHVIRHFYTTDFFQESHFDKSRQILSVYYLAGFTEPPGSNPGQACRNIKKNEGEQVSFRYADLNTLETKELSFPIDQHVLTLLKNEMHLHGGP
ncbi:MAG: NUDIX domain-containing protein [Bacteroidales bacterium]|jgi:ADP-ribose pyrophosphatase YjhB (NUDIX family)